ncbi:MAG: type II toxin-antitoxin system HipA family toxin [Elusimicrobiota bacterium]|jgi:serine/threonine-protein kinase HipA|nr:type II toxin-antitoxin system HipA family toxin [Elusimicrobiota bacterium]
MKNRENRENKEIFVHISLNGRDMLVGKLWFHSRRGRESASFEYDKSWLNNPERFALEPALQLTEGSFHTQDKHLLFGAIGDSAPDRWGRVLMRRAEAQRALIENETARTLTEKDYLLGVNDKTRQGALRFAQNIGGPFLKPSNKLSVPPLIELPKLLSASEKFLNSQENAEDLKLLLAPGSSLGGARPKASVKDKDGSLAFAKFPRKDDDFNIVLWEAVALTLAASAGITVPQWRVVNILKKPVLIVKRFDRAKETRIPFLSAMSMLGAADNEQHSYLEIVYAIAQHGAQPEKDMSELWRRIVFSVLISNTDDHLRNHGFLYERQKGWRLSPAYDINPTPTEIKPRILSTSIDLNNNRADLDLALSVIKDFRLSKEQAGGIIKEVATAVLRWRIVAKSLGLKEADIAKMSSAFEHQDLEKAKKFM